MNDIYVMYGTFEGIKCIKAQVDLEIGSIVKTTRKTGKTGSEKVGRLVLKNFSTRWYEVEKVAK